MYNFYNILPLSNISTSKTTYFKKVLYLEDVNNDIYLLGIMHNRFRIIRYSQAVYVVCLPEVMFASYKFKKISKLIIIDHNYLMAYCTVLSRLFIKCETV